jgi:flagellar basal body P-ring protein FlgI
MRVLAFLLLSLGAALAATRLKDLATIEGVRENQ